MENSQPRPIRKKEQAFLTRELGYWQQINLVGEKQAAAISGLYEPAKERFLQVFMALGALLVGLGVLSAVAANWEILGRAVKVSLIVGGYVLAMAAAYGFELSYPYTSRAFLLLGSFLYGGSIFLIAQIFHEGGHISTALFWWMAGIAPACLLFRDRVQLLLFQGISLIYFHWFYRSWWWFLSYNDSGFFYSFSSFLLSLVSPYPLIILAGLWVLWLRLGDRWDVGLHVNIFVTLNWLGIHASRYLRDVTALWLLLFVIGLILSLVPLGRLKDSLEDWGLTLTGVFGVVLSFPETWRWSRILRNSDILDTWSRSADLYRALAVTAAVLTVLALLWNVNKGSLRATVYFCLFILRYYFDVFYDFMDKALFFTAGGLLLMTMGFWFQRIRKKRKQAQQQAEVRS
ncbi:MAG: DUF2157 domain-containing protein [Synergistaceae bacterium]|jgi:uncharacterized membrane protein|nr:DUF2157 domain-containing protein [Synergistaceae bacterium]